MSVFLSPVGGAGAQFFDNNGNPLTGGKLYTYAAGTTTPQATYTSAAGSVFHTNPIILDAAGRVPGSSEIWLADNQIYKFVLKDSNDVLLATWDNITGVNSNFVNYTASQEIQTATAGQTVFNLTTMQYQPGTNSLTVYVDGVNQYGPGAQYAYLETDSDTVTFLSGLHVGASVKFTTATQTTGNATDASVVTYTPPFAGSVTTTVEDKLAQTVSVLDFGADPTGVTDSSASFAAAIATAKSIFVPKGIYQASFSLGTGQIVYGEGSKDQTFIKPPAGATYVIRIDASSSVRQYCQVRNLQLYNPGAVANCVGILFNGTDVNSINDWHVLSGLYITNFDRGIEVLGRQIWSSYYNVEVVNCRVGFNVSTDATTPAFNGNTFTQFRTAACEEEGVKIVGQNTTLGFYNCNFELCNTNDVAGVAAFYIEDCDQPTFITCYWEDNGGGVVVDGSNAANNSVGIKFAGTYCRNPKIEQAFFVGSGLLIWIAASVRGGILTNSRLNPLTGGFALYVPQTLSAVNDPTFVYDSSNFCTGTISVPQDVNGNYTARVNQVTSCYWMTTTQVIDLTQVSKLIVFPNGTTFTGVSAINNRIPGQELWVWNDSATNSFTIDSSLIFKGSGVIAAQTGKKYMVGGFPANGKLIEM